MTHAITSSAEERVPEVTYRLQHQPPLYFIEIVDLCFDLFDDYTNVTSRMTLRRNPDANADANVLVLNGDSGISLESISLDGELLSADRYQVDQEHLIIQNLPEQTILEIKNKIYPHKNTALSGLYLSRGKYCTQCEPEGFRRITYFLDRPDVLSRYTTTISAERERFPVLLSNGNILASGVEDGRHWVTWQDPFKKPCYLFALVAGHFDVLEDNFMTQSKREVALRIYVEKGYADQAHHAMYSLKEAMRWDEQAYGREYDLDIYMIVAISDFNMGAMENKGLNIFNTKYVLAKPETATDDDYIHVLSVIGHEYFHNWSGNRVTCRDWFQLSLKEGLTIFRDQSFTEDVLSKSVMRIRDVNNLREAQFPEDAGPLAHAVRPDSYIEINNFYTATVYEKGAEVLRMMQTVLGKEKFRKGMDLYFKRYDGQAVTIEDFVKAMEDVSGMDLSHFRLWYSQAGTPLVQVQDDYDEHQKIYRLNISQHTPDTPNQKNKEALPIPIALALFNQKGEPLKLNERKDSETMLHLSEPSQVFEFKNIQQRPIPSLLRRFSAPVKLQYQYAESDLALLFKHDTDSFNRFEAGTRYALRVILSLVLDDQHEKPLVLPDDFTDIYAYILEHGSEDPLLLAEMLNLPSEKYIGEQMEVIDVVAIHHSRELVLQLMAERLQSQFLAIYQRYHTATQQNEFNIATIGQRALKNRCLFYLMLSPKYVELGMNQFEQALGHNMTDTQAALVALANTDTPMRERALNAFYTQWKDDALVVDKWLAIQATSKLPGTLNHVRKLLRHEAFDIKNPNKVYALVGSFAGRNALHFHAENGEGYAFLREMVSQLDKLNPQVASRMVQPLTRWKRYDMERQSLMQKQLQSLLQEKNISTDLYELVSKSLQ